MSSDKTLFFVPLGPMYVDRKNNKDKLSFPLVLWIGGLPEVQILKPPTETTNQGSPEI